MNDLNDAELVALSLAGEREAFSTLITRHQARVRYTLLSVMPLHNEVDDLLQEAFLQAFLNLGSLQKPERFRSWVCGIGINLVRLWGRKRDNTAVFTLYQTALPDGTPSLEQQLIQQQRFEKLQEALSDLPKSEREALLLIYLDGLSHRETAVQLNTSLSAIKVRAHRGRRRLRKQLLSKENNMILVTIYDITRKAPPQEFGDKKEGLLDAFLQDLPNETRTLLLNEASISVTLPLGAQSAFTELPDDQKEAVHHALHALFPHHVVLLKEQEGERVLPIWIGPYEAEMIAVQLRQDEMLRPLSYDLFNSLLDVSNTAVVSANVTSLNDKVFIGALKISVDGKEQSIDCRPSDALTLATRLNSPIFVAPDIMAAEGMTLKEIQPKEKGTYRWERDGKVVESKTLL